MRLYLITLMNYDRFYILAKDEQTSKDKLEKILDTNYDYFIRDRIIKSIELIADTYKKDIFKEI